jgi:hypothetical protein
LNFAKESRLGYTVSDGIASQLGMNASQIQNWWAKFEALTQTNSIWLTAAANPVSWPPKGNRITTLFDGNYESSTAEIMNFQAEGVISVIDEKFDSDSIDLLAAKSQAIIIDSRLVPLTNLVNYTTSTRISAGSLSLAETKTPLLIADTQLTSLFEPVAPESNLSDEAAALQVRQQLASDLTMIALERPSTKVTVLAAPPTDWGASELVARSAASALVDGPWVKLVTLQDAIGLAPDNSPRQNASPKDLGKKQQLRPRQVSLLKQGQSRLEKLNSITSTPSLELGELGAALARGLSKSWVSQPKLGRELTTTITNKIEKKYQGVAVITSPEITLTGQLGALPVTVTNELDVPVRVNLSAETPSGASLDLDAARNIVIEANQVSSLDIPIEVQARINAPISLFLVNAEGQRIGASAEVSIRTTAYSQVAQWISIVSLVLLVILAAVSISKKVTKARKAK